ncbi:MAG: hypothetical protein ABSG80_08760 [Verrucomicrobiota bacterium]
MKVLPLPLPTVSFTRIIKYRVRHFVSLILTTAVAYLTVQANAQMLTFEFSGTLTEVGNDPLAGTWGSVGDPFWGYLSFDPTWQNSNGSSFVDLNNDGWYNYPNAYAQTPAEQAITMSLSTPSRTAQTENAPFNPTYLIAGGSPGNYTFSCQGNWYGELAMSFILTDATGAGISGTSIPSNLDLNDWAIHYVDIEGGAGNVQGDITSIQLVPEPRVEMMIGLGIIVWSLRRRASNILAKLK